MIEPKQARSLATRMRLLDAAVEVLVEDGHAGLSAATVARRAGVSRGAHQHHFPNRQTLLIEALRHLAESEQATLRQRLETLGDGEERLVRAVDIVFETYCGRLFATILELALASRREPELEAAIREEERSMTLSTHEVGVQLFGSDTADDPGFGRRWAFAIAVVRGVAILSFLGHPKQRVQRQWEFGREQILAVLRGRD
jgi:AcrR family transcriptional regulator